MSLMIVHLHHTGAFEIKNFKLFVWFLGLLISNGFAPLPLMDSSLERLRDFESIVFPHVLQQKLLFEVQYV